MRKLYVFTLFFLFSLANSQTYSFDFLTKYVSQGKNQKSQSEIVNYFNSDNFNYYLRLMRGSGYFTAYLTDYELNIQYEFNVIENKKGNEIAFQFEYLNSNKLNLKPSLRKNFRYEWKKINNNEAVLKIFKTKKAKKPVEEYQFTFKKSNKNLFPVFRMAAMHPLENEKNVNIDENFIVEKAKNICNYPPCSCEFRLAEYKNVSLDLVIPK